ncbi:MAG: hypothetical protein KA248_13510 [Kiritimatiellae bacterium]|nr:hypothetical protein [Kiritimatiellia bacterium]
MSARRQGGLARRSAGYGWLLAAFLVPSARAGIESEAVRELVGMDSVIADLFGTSVALHGDVAVLGAPFADPLGQQGAGTVYVFERNAQGTNTWAQGKKLTASDPLTGDQLGRAVAVDGDIIVAGRLYADVGTHTNQGAAHVFQRNAGGTNNWGEVAKLVSSDGATGDVFGVAMAVDGDIMVVGAMLHDTPGINAAGAAYVFERRASGTTSAWVEVSKLMASNPAAIAYFGASVDVDGDVVAVGAPGFSGGVSGIGRTYLFERNAHGGDAWGQVAELAAADAAAGATFGESVALDNGTLIVGAPGSTLSAATNTGSAYCFVRTRGGTNRWQQVAKLQPSDPSPGQDFGRAVELRGDLAIVGASRSNFVYVFQRDAGGEDAWGEVARVAAPSTLDSTDEFGVDVALQSGVLLVGASGGGPADSGAAYLYPVVHEEWARYGTRSQNNRAADDEFGAAVDMDGSVLIVGAPYRDLDGTNDVGAAYIFERGTRDQVRRLLSPGPSEDDGFGMSVAVDGDVAVVGEPLDDLYGFNAGRAYVYHRNEGGTNNWGRITEISALLSLTTPTTNDTFGSAVDISGDTIIVGRPGRSDNRGMVDFFVRNQDGTNAWGFVSSTLGSVQLENRFFGSSLAIDGDTAIVAAPGDNFTNGAVYIVQRQAGSTNIWREIRRISSPDAQLNDAFGRNVALSGDTALVNAYSLGKAYLFERDGGGTNAWGQAGVLIPTNADGVTFGGINSVHIHGDIAVLGDPFASVDGTNGGAAWVFERHAGGSNAWGQVAVVRQTAPAALDRFGYDVAVGGQTLLVGVPQDDPNGVTNAGRAVVFSGFLHGPPRIRALAKAGGATTLSFPAQPAWRYSVEGTLDLSGGSWLPIPGQTDLPGPPEGELTLTHTNVFGQAVYRVVREAP